ncbi:CBS domain-containing protein [Streptomyces sp. SAT1]|uniref:CBS domain-containing protein n=1 Tax=Streptomyces sp. SAT1 TaxID=1849967 RepID=UPI000B070804|nr:CBS domain-containing protein [Streptomyces sp. SAT1]
MRGVQYTVSDVMTSSVVALAGGAAEPPGRATAPAVTVRADATVAGAARLMARHGVEQLPVVDDAGRLIGIVGRSDLLKVFLRSDEDIAEEVRRLVAGRFPVPLDTVFLEVREGVVFLTGHTPDASSLPLVLRLARSGEGVVDVRSAITAPGRHGAAPGRSGANLPGPGAAAARSGANPPGPRTGPARSGVHPPEPGADPPPSGADPPRTGADPMRPDAAPARSGPDPGPDRTVRTDPSAHGTRT